MEPAENEEQPMDDAEEQVKEVPYWLVHCPTQGPAHYKHFSRISAENEAERLARAHPDHKFYVLQTVSARFVRDPVERVDFDVREEIEIPF